MRNEAKALADLHQVSYALRKETGNDIRGHLIAYVEQVLLLLYRYVAWRMLLPLPPGLSGPIFDSACKELRGVVGDDWVLTTDDRLASYADPYSPGVADEYAPSGAILPTSVEEIRSVLAIANRYGLPLWTVSLGRNYAYGGAAPCLKGSMILDLNRMRAIKVDAELAYAVVEPGVTYLDLYKFIQDNKYPLWIDCPDPGWGSVLGNTLEHGIGYTAYGDHAGHQCGMEVVLADGQVVRTGLGAMDGNPAWPLYKYSFGPSLDGLFMQSNFGVVSKIGVWLMPEPQTFSVVEMMFRREEDIAPMIDALRVLRLDGTVPTATIANWMRIAAGNTTRAEWYDGKGALPHEAVERLIKGMGIGYWGMRFGLYGREKILARKREAVEEAFSRIDGVEMTVATYVRGEKIAPEHGTLAGIPSVDLMPLNWLGGAGAHIECPLVVPMRGAEFHDLYQRRTELFNNEGFDHYCGLTSTTPRSFINTGSIIFDRNNAEQCARARALGRTLIEDAHKRHLAGYRAHISEMDFVAAQFDFNDHAALRTYERLKDALDPGGVLSPGKQGIWPKALREAKDTGGRKP
ncbi:MAG: FAD-binding oxidoreductase [Methyloceanibacter sp.]